MRREYYGDDTLKLSDIYFKDDDDLNIILSENENQNNIISKITLEILNSFFCGNDQLIFSQGPLNMTILLASIYSLRYNQDVVIFLPQKNFEKNYKKYMKDFFSIQYSTQNYPFTTFFLYNKILLCQGRLNDHLELTDLDIASKPIYGDLDFRRKYSQFIWDKWRKGTLTTTREIVFIPIETSIPSQILGEKNIKLGEEKKNILNFDPQLFIFESMNENNYSFERIDLLIKLFNKMKRRYIFHFSWPYLRGAERFLNTLTNQKSIEKIAVFHLGKRLCMELGRQLIKPPPYALQISLEADLWERQYYPFNTNVNKHIILPSLGSFLLSTEDLEVMEYETDTYVYEINKLLNEIQCGYFIDSILRFPPCLDSFVLPQEIKDFDKNIMKFIPLNDIISKKLKDHQQLLRFFNTVNRNIEKHRDLFYQINGLNTMTRITKRTLFQMYILQSLNIDIEEAFVDEPKKRNKIIIANLFPKLNSTNGIREMLNYMLQSIQGVIEDVKFPSLRLQNDFVILIDNNNTPICNLWHLGTIFVPNLELIINRMKYNYSKYPIKITSRQIEGGIEVRIFLDLFTKYADIDTTSNSLKINSCIWEGFNLCIWRAYHNGNWEYLVLKDLKVEDSSNFRSFNSNWIYQDYKTKKEINKDIEIQYMNLNNIRTLSIESVMNSILMVPGPIPFTSTSNERVFLSEGYDVILMPFKKIIFFAYPGRNINYLIAQLRIYRELFSEKLTEIGRRDLAFSCKYTQPNLANLIKTNYNQNTTNENLEFDNSIRQELLNEEITLPEDRKTIRKIKDIIDVIGNQVEENEHESEDEVSTLLEGKPSTDIELEVKFDDGNKEKIVFETGTLLRKKELNEYVLVPVNNLREGDEIIYITKGRRKQSIDDYLLGIFLDNKMVSLKQIFEPFICLKIICDVLQTIESNNHTSSKSFNDIYWLNDDQKWILFRVIRALLNNENIIAKKYFVSNFNIWKSFITVDELANILNSQEKRNRLTYEKIYEIAKKAGFNLKLSTFKEYCSFDTKIDKHYFFREDVNLLAIGYLIGNQENIENYDELNRIGKQVGIFLQMIGRRILQIAEGKRELLDEIDILIENHMQKCKILSVSVLDKL